MIFYLTVLLNYEIAISRCMQVVSMISKDCFLFKPEVHNAYFANSESFLKSFNLEIEVKTLERMPHALSSMDRLNRALLFTTDILNGVILFLSYLLIQKKNSIIILSGTRL